MLLLLASRSWRLELPVVFCLRMGHSKFRGHAVQCLDKCLDSAYVNVQMESKTDSTGRLGASMANATVWLHLIARNLLNSVNLLAM